MVTVGRPLHNVSMIYGIKNQWRECPGTHTHEYTHTSNLEPIFNGRPETSGEGKPDLSFVCSMSLQNKVMLFVGIPINPGPDNVNTIVSVHFEVLGLERRTISKWFWYPSVRLFAFGVSKDLLSYVNSKISRHGMVL